MHYPVRASTKIIQGFTSRKARCSLDPIIENEGRETTVTALQGIVGHEFRNRDLLIQALTHSSFSNEHAGTGATVRDTSLSDNERLEFLGDAVIGLVVAEMLMERFPGACEGKLSRWRSNLVSRKTLAEMAIELRLGDYLFLGRGEKRTGGAEKRSILAAGVEAVVGALYLDGGLTAVTPFLFRIYQPWFETLGDGGEEGEKIVDKKTYLQEKTQSLYKTTPVYRLTDVWGLEHEKHFRVEILVGDRVVASGDGRSKKEAEQNAAHVALETLGLL